MRYRYLKRLILFLIFLSVVCILSVSKWNTRDETTFNHEGLNDIHVQLRVAGVGKRTSENNEEFSAESTSLRVKDYMLLVGSVGSSENADHVTGSNGERTEAEELSTVAEVQDAQTDNGLQGSDPGSLSHSGSSGAKSLQYPSDAPVTPTKAAYRHRVKKKLYGNFSGYVNVHIWEEWCGHRVLDLRRNKHFPLYPDIRQVATRLYLRYGERQYGQRIFGYIHPPGTGNYLFAVSSDDSSEIWLSVSDDPELIQKVALVWDGDSIANTLLGQFDKYKGQISKPVYLEQGKKYYIEILHKQLAYKDHILVAWKGPSIPVFKVINSRYLSAYLDEDEISSDVTELASYIPETAASFPTHLHGDEARLYTFNRSAYSFGGADSRDDFHKVPFVEEGAMTGLFPTCKYRPSYLVDFKVKRYEGIYLVHDTAIYPNDLTELSHMYSDCENREEDSHGNELESTKESGTAEPTETVQNSSNVYFKISSFLSGLKNGLQSYISRALPTVQPVTVEKGQPNTHNNSVERSAKTLVSSIKPAATEDNSLKLKWTSRDAAQRRAVGAKMIRRKFIQEGRLNVKALDALKFLRQRMQKRPSYPMKAVKRKLLSISQYSFKTPGYEVDDEELPNSSNKRKLIRPIFVPIQGVENETLSFRAFSSLPERPTETELNVNRAKLASDRNYFNYGSDDTRNSSDGKIYINPEIFKLKSAKDFMKYYRIFKSSIYAMIKELPRPDTWKFRQHRSECKSDGNLLLNEKVAQSVVGRVLRRIQEKSENKYTLKKIVNVEENHDVINGDRYLVELDLKMQGYGDQSFRFSRYLYQPIGTLNLCEPEGLQWNPHSTVHVIVPVKNQGRWVQHFIDNMEKIYLETLDNHLNIIVVDFNSSDIDIESCFKKSKLPRYRVVHLDGPFQRALGIQAGADLVDNPHDIVFTCDLHLEIPSHLIDSIRKHCIEGHMAFAPVVVRLECGYTPDLPYGLWEIQGYGLFAVCKSDFDRIGGMNTKEFKTKWGGEDWEMLDRVLSHGIEVERLRIPKFYHYHHSKKRMWVSRNVEE